MEKLKTSWLSFTLRLWRFRLHFYLRIPFKLGYFLVDTTNTPRMFKFNFMTRTLEAYGIEYPLEFFQDMVVGSKVTLEIHDTGVIMTKWDKLND